MATQGVLGAATLKEFDDGLHGEMVKPGDGAYDEARSIWNGAHDARPALIARCADASDVRHAVGFARSAGLDVALRGGGGNFGVVTSFEFDVHPVGPTVAAGPVFYPGDRAEEILRFYREFVKTVPDELTTFAGLLTAPPAPFLPEEWHGKKLVALVGCYSGDPDEGMKALQPLRDLGDPVADLVGPMPYVQMQSLLDDLYPRGTNAYMKAGYLGDLDDHAIETAIRYHQDATSPASEIHLHHFGGAISRVDAEESAYGERQAPYVLNTIALTHEPGPLDTHIAWAHRLYADIEPSLTGAAYINFLSAEGEDRVQAAYGAEKFARLRELKDRYDPTNLFHLNQNIPPSKAS